MTKWGESWDDSYLVSWDDKEGSRGMTGGRAGLPDRCPAMTIVTQPPLGRGN